MNVCKVCGAASVAHVMRPASGTLRYRCNACRAEWSADAPEIKNDQVQTRPGTHLTNDRDRRTLMDRRTASADRRTTLADRRRIRSKLDEHQPEDPATGVTRAEHEGVLQLVQQNVGAIRRLDEQIRRIAKHLGLDLAPESQLNSRAS